VIGVVPSRAVLVLAYMAGIFALSALPATRVASLGIRGLIADLAHVPLYAGLGSLTLFALRGSLATRAGAALAIGFAFAASDEWHQRFVPGRVFSLADLGSDALGLALGVGALVWFEGQAREA
jgi:VanZ family protein